MSQTSDNLMKQFDFIMRASRYFMFKNKQPISGQKRVLAVLKLEDGLTQNYLAEILALKPGSLAELLKKMEVKGVIRRATDDQDKRVKRVYLTKEGQTAANQLEELEKNKDTAAFFAGLTTEEQAEFSHYLEKIAAGWDDDFREYAQRFIDPASRMKAMAKWHEYRQKHGWTSSTMPDHCRMHARRDYPVDFDRDALREKYHHYSKMHHYNHDFWSDFWDNDKEDGLK